MHSSSQSQYQERSSFTSQYPAATTQSHAINPHPDDSFQRYPVAVSAAQQMPESESYDDDHFSFFHNEEMERYKIFSQPASLGFAQHHGQLPHPLAGCGLSQEESSILANLKAENDSLRKKLKESNDQKSSVEAKLALAKHLNVELDAKTKVLDQARVSLIRDFQSESASHYATKMQLEQSQAKLVKLSKECKSLNKQIKKLNQDKEMLESKVKSASDSHANSLVMLKAKQTELDEIQTQLDKLSNSYKFLLAQKQRVDSELRTVRDLVVDLSNPDPKHKSDVSYNRKHAMARRSQSPSPKKKPKLSDDASKRSIKTESSPGKHSPPANVFPLPTGVATSSALTSSSSFFSSSGEGFAGFSPTTPSQSLGAQTVDFQSLGVSLSVAQLMLASPYLPFVAFSSLATQPALDASLSSSNGSAASGSPISMSISNSPMSDSSARELSTYLQAAIP